MTNFIPFPPNLEPLIDMVRITAGTVTRCTDPRDIGRFLNFVEYVDPEGGCLIVWSGTTHQDALTAAREWEADGAVVVDETTIRLH